MTLGPQALANVRVDEGLAVGVERLAVLAGALEDAIPRYNNLWEKYKP